MSRKRPLQDLNLNDDNIEFKKLKPIKPNTDLKESENQSNNEQPQINLSDFDSLPVELKVLIFRQLEYKDLSILSIVNRTFRDIIVNHFLVNRDHLVKLFNAMINCRNDEVIAELATDFGLFIKRSTFVFPISKRIKLIIGVFENVDLKTKLRNIYSTNRTMFKEFTKAIKFIMSAVITGWKFKEVLKLFDELELYLNNTELINSFLVQELGSVRTDEQYLRCVYRRIMFESFSDNSSRAKWLNYFIRYHSTITSCPNQKLIYQSKLILLLFAPIFQDDSGLIYIDWFVFSNSILISEGLEYIGFALKILNNLKPRDKPDIIGLFNQITSTGFFWLYENSSTLLFYCGLNFIKRVIDELIRFENFLTVTRFFTNLFIIESKLVYLNRIQPADKITNLLFDYLKYSLDQSKFDNILELASLEFINISKEVEEMQFDREYLTVTELIVGQQSFFEIRLKKSGLCGLTVDKDFFLSLTKRSS